MTKKGPLSKAEKFYIENKHGETELNTLCKELDRAKSIVKTHVDKCKKNENTGHDIGSQFASNDNGATVMTPNASEMADSMRGQTTETNRQHKCVTSIRRVQK